MDLENIKKQIEAKEEIRHHDYQYYVLDQPVITDAEYDLMKQLVELEEKYQNLNLQILLPSGWRPAHKV